MLPQSQSRGSQVVAVTAAGFAAAALVLLVISYHNPASHAAVVAGLNKQQAVSRGAACSLEFLGYEPSEWEARWRAQVQILRVKACATMLEDRDLVDAWMVPMNDSFRAGVAAAELPAMQGSKVFSHFRHRDSCTGDVVRTPIEPLVGTLRHPVVNAECARLDRRDFVVAKHDSPKQVRDCQEGILPCGDPFGKPHIENKGYMVVQPLPTAAIYRLYPGRKVLFDLGTGQYESGSLPWFFDTFERKGVVFDEIWGWEVKEIPQKEYWGAFPPDISYKMHFRNVPCEVEPDSPQNPLNIVRKIYRPGDYIAFKLDIDNERVEQALMAQLDADTVPMIAEFFFEQHYDIPEMRPYFHTREATKTKLPDVLEMFFRFREQGLRLHYWP